MTNPDEHAALDAEQDQGGDAVDQQARAILEDWLENDDHGLRIPDTDWGISLLGALRHILYSPQVSGRTPRPLTEDAP